jgi:3',5'-cyclic-AMP phosphodiesterase
MSERFTLAQISDLHVGAEGAAAKLRAVLDALRPRRLDAIIATGDLVNDERAEEYAELAAILRDPPAPVFLAPGNHDEIHRLRAAFPSHHYLPREGPLSYVVEHLPLRLVVVDQTVPGEVHGDFTPAHAEWLDDALSRLSRQPAVVALHHPPFATHDALFDTIALRNAERFAAVIARHRQVQRIICGHHHRLALGAVAHVPVVIAPSTAYSYGLAIDPGDPLAPKTNEPTGYMLHAWTRQAGMASHFMAV